MPPLRPNQTPNDLFIRFYTSDGLDSERRKFDEIIRLSDEELESSHNYIQWLFPLAKASKFNSSSPVLDENLLKQLKNSQWAKIRMRVAFKRMLRFYGFVFQKGGKMVRADNWEERKKVWLTTGNHNFLRITRILKCMRSVGLEGEVTEFYNHLLEISREEGSPISAKTLKFWKEAAGG